MIIRILWLFLTVSCVGMQCVIVVFPDHTHLLFVLGIRLNRKLPCKASFIYVSLNPKSDDVFFSLHWSYTREFPARHIKTKQNNNAQNMMHLRTRLPYPSKFRLLSLLGLNVTFNRVVSYHSALFPVSSSGELPILIKCMHSFSSS